MRMIAVCLIALSLAACSQKKTLDYLVKVDGQVRSEGVREFPSEKECEKAASDIKDGINGLSTMIITLGALIGEKNSPKIEVKAVCR